MPYSIDPRIFEIAPDYCRIVIVARNADNHGPDQELEFRFCEAVRSISLEPKANQDDPRVSRWKEIYRKIGLPSGVRPSMENLIRRIKKDAAAIPFISKMVCISNLISLNHVLPSGLVDLSQVSDDLALRFSSGDDIFHPIGSTDVIAIRPGEVIYQDLRSWRILCRGWNSRGSIQTRITEETTGAIVDIDGLTDAIPLEELQQAGSEVARLLATYCRAECEVHILDRRQPSFSFSHQKTAQPPRVEP